MLLGAMDKQNMLMTILTSRWHAATLSVTLLAMLVLPVAAQTVPIAASELPRASMQIVLVLDGLRPDSITPVNTPNLDRLRSNGVQFDNTHAVFPTVTRVNSASLGTGVYPNRHGIMGNSITCRLSIRCMHLATITSAIY